MKIHFDNINLSSRTGPNSFASRLAKELIKLGHKIELEDGSNCDVSLVFIEPTGRHLAKKIVQRLDGIWFSPKEFDTKNTNIKSLYSISNHVIWQSNFDKIMTTKWWKEPLCGSIIRNGIENISVKNAQVEQQLNHLKNKYEKIFVCSANWHPQKRLSENFRLFKHIKNISQQRCCLIVMGNNPIRIEDLDVFYTGNLSHDVCMQIFENADWMLHLAWLDHCPNTVVEALSKNLPVICTEAGGTCELVTNYGIMLKEDKKYDFELVDYENPPILKVEQLTKLPEKTSLGNPPDVSINFCAKEYLKVFENLL
jgi:glycosyltransferase involved in cell wall biosynthesis